MTRILLSFLICTASLWSLPAWAVDSYRYLHVTIDTPWAIFLFLLPIVLSPFILMAFLYWRFAGRSSTRAALLVVGDTATADERVQTSLPQLDTSKLGSGRT